MTILDGRHTAEAATMPPGVHQWHTKRSVKTNGMARLSAKCVVTQRIVMMTSF